MNEPEEDWQTMNRTYAGVLLAEVAFLVALWLLGRYFGSN